MKIFHTIALILMMVISFSLLLMGDMTSGESMIIYVLCILGFIIINKK